MRPNNPFSYMAVYMREYRMGFRRGRSRLQLGVAGNVSRCPSCTILSPAMCRQCEIEEVRQIKKAVRA